MKLTRACLLVLSALGIALLGGCEEDVIVGNLDGGGGSGGDGSGGDDASSAWIHIHLTSTTDPFDHQDGLAGQTPLEHTSGIKSLTLFESEGSEPLVVFDHAEAVEVDYADGADTVVASVRASELRNGTYTIARVVHSWVRYRVETLAHTDNFTVPGELDSFQVLSDGTLYGGEELDAGHYVYTFSAGGFAQTVDGTNAPVPEWPDTGGFSVRVEDGEWAYYFPVNIPVDTTITEDRDVLFGVNMDESFRWQDQDTKDFEDGEFDVTDTGAFEPVMHFGANSFSVSIE